MLKTDTAEFLAFTQLRGLYSLCDYLGTDYRKNYVYYFVRLAEAARYTEFEISKRNGETRTIQKPRDGVAFVQRRLATKLQDIYQPGTSVHGFARDRSILTNARVHQGKRWILKLDIKDFFGTINFGRVRGLFLAPPFKLPEVVATAIAKIACHKNALPQGAPSSPIISNLIAASLDSRMISICKVHGLNYTRYADDIAISSRRGVVPPAIGAFSDDKFQLSTELVAAVADSGFELRAEKTHFIRRDHRQVVTGLVVNERPNVDRRYLRNLYAAVHALQRYGPAAFQATYASKFAPKNTREVPKALPSLRGKIEYVGQIKGLQSEVYLKLARYFNSVSPLKIRITELSEEMMKSVFIVEGESDDQLSFDQGTCFYIGNGLFVTCAHCVAYDKLNLFSPKSPASIFSVKVVAKEEASDVALISVVGDLPEEVKPLVLGKPALLANGSPVKIIGYPAWAPGKIISMKTADVQSSFTKSTFHHFVFDKAIVAGNSGGPVLDTFGRVVAVASRGAKNSDEAENVYEHAGVSIEALSQLLAATLGDA